MLKYMRNKLVRVARMDDDTLMAFGILDDDVYSLELDVKISISDLEIISIDGRWNRWTTPECPRSNQFLSEAIGFRIGDELNQKVHKIIGRKACRHYANLLLECCHSAKEAAWLLAWEDKKEEDPELTFEEFLEGKLKSSSGPNTSQAVKGEEASVKVQEVQKKVVREKTPGELMIDLHTHTFPASQCSSVGVDELISEAKRIGLDGICLTDHNYVWNPDDIEDLRQKHGFLVLGGNEITTDQGDMLVFGMYKDIKGVIKLDDLKVEVEKVGGFIIVAHPFRGFLTFNVGDIGLTPEKAMERPMLKLVHAIEVLNGKVTERENDLASKVAEGLGIKATAGSDAHDVSEVGVYATQFFDAIKCERDLVDALKSGNFSPVVFMENVKYG